MHILYYTKANPFYLFLLNIRKTGSQSRTKFTVTWLKNDYVSIITIQTNLSYQHQSECGNFIHSHLKTSKSNCRFLKKIIHRKRGSLTYVMGSHPLCKFWIVIAWSLLFDENRYKGALFRTNTLVRVLLPYMTASM